MGGKNINLSMKITNNTLKKFEDCIKDSEFSEENFVFTHMNDDSSKLFTISFLTPEEGTPESLVIPSDIDCYFVVSSGDGLNFQTECLPGRFFLVDSVQITKIENVVSLVKSWITRIALEIKAINKIENEAVIDAGLKEKIDKFKDSNDLNTYLSEHEESLWAIMLEDCRLQIQNRYENIINKFKSIAQKYELQNNERIESIENKYSNKLKELEKRIDELHGQLTTSTKKNLLNKLERILPHIGNIDKFIGLLQTGSDLLLPI